MKKITGPLFPPTTLLWHKVDVREENIRLNQQSLFQLIEQNRKNVLNCHENVIAPSVKHLTGWFFYVRSLV